MLKGNKDVARYLIVNFLTSDFPTSPLAQIMKPIIPYIDSKYIEYKCGSWVHVVKIIEMRHSPNPYINSPYPKEEYEHCKVNLIKFLKNCAESNPNEVIKSIVRKHKEYNVEKNIYVKNLYGKPKEKLSGMGFEPMTDDPEIYYARRCNLHSSHVDYVYWCNSKPNLLKICKPPAEQQKSY